MTNEYWNTLSVLIIAALAVSISATALSIGRVSSIDLITGMATSTPSGKANVTVPSKTYISLPIDMVNFGELDVGLSNDTTDDSPLPFTLRNDGTVNVNVTIGATDLFTGTGGGNPSTYYQYKSEEYEVGSVINTTTDLITTFINMPTTGSPEMVVSRLRFPNAYDSIKVHLNVTVPLDEAAGEKTSTVTFTATQA